MIVPQHWSEAKTKKIVNGRAFTIKRFGWSDTSDQDAQEHAQARLSEAVKTLEEQGDIRRIDHKISYNGAEGIPIREEVIAKHQDVVISRNSYGSLCLNTPDVLFADIDFEYKASFKTKVVAFILLSVCAALVALGFQSWPVLFLCIFLAAIVTSVLARLIHRVILSLKGGPEEQAMEGIKKVSIENATLNIRLYRTPKGFRVLLMNDTFSPTSDDTIVLLQSLNSDKIYIQMCKNQHCFRARVSPKPWRIGLKRLTPRPSVWPIKAERMAARKAWVGNYEKKAREYSSCHYLLHLGSDKVNEKAEFVRQLHDKMCKTDRNDLKIA